MRRTRAMASPLKISMQEVYDSAFLIPFVVILSVTALVAWTISFRSEDTASFKNGSFNATCL
ncbi:hypothetical protein L208DRAFT_882795 [Tricholoma matsutake]|nr:hypothetical protein L208DRAFT_882795 [Tricholoma matsutake 945]